MLDFWVAYWNRGQSLPPLPTEVHDALDKREPPIITINSTTFSIGEDIKTILLPSPHHQNPMFAPLGSSKPPATPLNNYLLHVLDGTKGRVI